MVMFAANTVQLSVLGLYISTLARLLVPSSPPITYNTPLCEITPAFLKIFHHWDWKLFHCVSCVTCDSSSCQQQESTCCCRCCSTPHSSSPGDHRDHPHCRGDHAALPPPLHSSVLTCLILDTRYLIKMLFSIRWQSKPLVKMGLILRNSWMSSG